MYRVVAEEVRQRRRVRDIVHRHEVDVLAPTIFPGRPHDHPPDPTETIDPHSHGHVSITSIAGFVWMFRARV